MKKIIVSLDHVVGAIMAAYEKEMGIKSMDCCTERDGRICMARTFQGTTARSARQGQPCGVLSSCGGYSCRLERRRIYWNDTRRRRSLCHCNTCSLRHRHICLKCTRRRGRSLCRCNTCHFRPMPSRSGTTWRWWRIPGWFVSCNSCFPPFFRYQVVF